MAMVIPFHSSKPGRGSSVLIVVLTPENLSRMRTGDPFDTQASLYASALDLDRPLRELDLIVAYEEDEQALQRIAKEGGLPAILAHLERGRQHRTGDAEPPVSIKPRKVTPQ
jgi:hypothetical protein